MGSSTSPTQLLSFLQDPSFSDRTNRHRFGNPSRCTNFRPLRAVENSPLLISKEESNTEICQDKVPERVLCRTEEVGYVMPTDVQREALPVLFSGQDCVLHAQVTKVSWMLAAKPLDVTVMALLDGGMLRRHKSWLKAEPPTMVVATITSLCQMLEKQIFKLDSMRVLVVDEIIRPVQLVDFMFYSSKQVSSLRKLLTSYSSYNTRQTVFSVHLFLNIEDFCTTAYNKNGQRVM